MKSRLDIVVSVNNASKKFARSLKRSLAYGACDIGRAALGMGTQSSLRKTEFWAVRDVSFELQKGQSIGVMGANGSGKTTLMRLVAGVLQPTLGAVEVRGRIAPLLALGAGFKPVLSGRENVFLNLSILGMSQSDIRSRFDSIVEFAELSDAIDAPIGTYSSGLLARLGFSCAVHTDPDVLIVDEVLSVGDARFRAKCRNRINELRKAGTSMLLVSHSAILLQALCDECLYVKQGMVAARGITDEVLRTYEADFLQTVPDGNAGQSPWCSTSKARDADRLLAVQRVHFKTMGGVDENTWLMGKPADMVLSLHCGRLVDKLSVNVMVVDLANEIGQTVQFMTSHRDIGWLRLDAGRSEIRLSIPAVGLRPGTYRVKISLSQGAMHDILDVVDDLRLVVRDTGIGTNCLYYQPREWHISGGAVTEPSELRETPEFESVEDL